MANIDKAIEKITDDIAQTGALTAEATRRYETMFATFKSELSKELNNAENLGEAARHAMLILDEATHAMRTSFPHQPKRDCRDGCSACCHLFVSVPPGVIELVTDYIHNTFSKDEQDALIPRLKTAAAKIETAKTITEVRARCPLLDRQDRCSIYPVRPLSCRAFTSSDVSRCHAMVFENDQQTEISIGQDPGHFRLHVEATKALEHTAVKRGLDGRQKGFVHALLDRLAPSQDRAAD